MSGVPPFISKLFAVLNNPEYQPMINWLPAGNGLCVEKAREQDFIDKVLPILCKSRSMCSFVRQLNGYGFSKSDPKSVSYTHSVFHRGHPERLHLIARQKSAKRQAREDLDATVDDGEAESQDEPEAVHVKRPALSPTPAAVPAVAAPSPPAPLPPCPLLDGSPAVLSTPALGPPIAALTVPTCPREAPHAPPFSLGLMLDGVSTMKSFLAGCMASSLGSTSTDNAWQEGIRHGLMDYVNRQRSMLAPHLTHANCAPLPRDVTLCQLSSALSDLLVLIPSALAVAHGSPRTVDRSMSSASLPCHRSLSQGSASSGEHVKPPELPLPTPNQVDILSWPDDDPSPFDSMFSPTTS